ncbi:hypothetical protein ACSFA2_03730 [Variovorax sp. LT2P21]|uniref:hypothetical protein n=1 Tax=Variovorax sp. LT2P21 TaxID=3443731 RepID=UPI003F451A57
MNNVEYTLAVASPGTSVKVALAGGGAAAVTTNAIGYDTAVVTADVDCFFRKSATANATSDGTDQFMVAKNTYRIFGLLPADKLSFNSATAGNVYITPGA